MARGEVVVPDPGHIGNGEQRANNQRPNGCLIKFGVGFMLATLIFMCFMGFVLYKILSNKFNDDISKLTDDISILTDDNSKLNDDISKLRDDLNQSLESHKSLQEKFQNISEALGGNSEVSNNDTDEETICEHLLNITNKINKIDYQIEKLTVDIAKINGMPNENSTDDIVEMNETIWKLTSNITQIKAGLNSLANKNSKLGSYHVSNFPIAAIESGGTVIVSSYWRNDHHLGYYLWSKPYDYGYAAAWCARVDNQEQWIQISTITGGPVRWTEIKTMGRASFSPYEYVKKYTISYTTNGSTWKTYGSPHYFTGNNDINSIKTNSISPSITAIAIRIHPTQWSISICMRLEAYYSSHI